MGIFNRKQKEETTMKKDNKFAGRRQYAIRAGLPEKILKRLIDLHELLQCDPDQQGYVVTTFKEMNELTEMDVNMMTIMVQNGIMQKRTTGGSPKFKYKWDTIDPTMDMAVKLLDKKLEMKKGPEELPEPEGIVSESKPESIVEKHAHLEPLVTEEKAEELRFEELTTAPTVLIDSQVDENNVMTMHINLEKFEITEAEVISAVMVLVATRDKK